MKVSVNADVCEGHARCWDICPDVFGLDDEGHAFVIGDEVPAGLEAIASKAADNCPERAITVS